MIVIITISQLWFKHFSHSIVDNHFINYLTETKTNCYKYQFTVNVIMMEIPCFFNRKLVINYSAEHTYHVCNKKPVIPSVEKHLFSVLKDDDDDFNNTIHLVVSTKKKAINYSFFIMWNGVDFKLKFNCFLMILFILWLWQFYKKKKNRWNN